MKRVVYIVTAYGRIKARNATRKTTLQRGSAMLREVEDQIQQVTGAVSKETRMKHDSRLTSLVFIYKNLVKKVLVKQNIFCITKYVYNYYYLSNSSYARILFYTAFIALTSIVAQFLPLNLETCACASAMIQILI